MSAERATLELALAAIDAASKGYHRSDEEDDWQECIVCRGWIGSHGHSATCKLIDAGNALRKALAEPDAGDRPALYSVAVHFVPGELKVAEAFHNLTAEQAREIIARNKLREEIQVVKSQTTFIGPAYVIDPDTFERSRS